MNKERVVSDIFKINSNEDSKEKKQTYQYNNRVFILKYSLLNFKTNLGGTGTDFNKYFSAKLSTMTPIYSRLPTYIG
jgi:hypothetical protein